MHYNLLMPGSKVMYSAAAFRGEPCRVDNKETKTYRQTDRQKHSYMCSGRFIRFLHLYVEMGIIRKSIRC